MSWKTEQTIGIGADRAGYMDKAKYFHRAETDASVSAAVDKLNKEELVAEDGYCIVYSDANSEFFLLWQEGKKDQAFKAAGLNEKEKTTKERVVTAIEQNPEGEYQVGQEVEYWSSNRAKWFPTKIKAMKPDGSMQLVIHQDGRWVSKRDAVSQVRLKPGAGLANLDEDSDEDELLPNSEFDFAVVSGIPVSYIQVKQLAMRNKMLNVMEDRGSLIAVVGDTSTGKSTTINFLLGFPVLPAGIGTRRPCVICQVYKEDAKTVQFNVAFTKGGEVINIDCGKDWEKVVHDLVGKANCHRNSHYFDCIHEYRELNNDQEIPEGHIFDTEPIYITMYHESFIFGLRFIDLPGLTRSCEAPLRIAEKYIQPGNAVMLVIGRDRPSNGQFPKLAGKMADCSTVVFMQNFATKVLDVIEERIAEIKEAFKKNVRESNDPGKIAKCNKLAEELVLHLTEYGYPCTPELKDQGCWKDGVDQLDWIEESKNNFPQEVRAEMWGHANMRAVKIMRENPQIVSYMIKAGLQDPLNELIQYQLCDLPRSIYVLRECIKNDIREKTELVEKLEKTAPALEPETRYMEEKGKLQKLKGIVEMLDNPMSEA